MATQTTPGGNIGWRRSENNQKGRKSQPAPGGFRATPNNMKLPQQHAVWRKGRDGQWCLCGPLSLLQDRRGPIRVQCKDGSVEHRRVIWNSKPFDVDGVPHCYAMAEEKRKCESCDGWHLRQQVLDLNGKNKDVRWCHGQKTCDCGGLLALPTSIQP
jgi:hypothetical protein